MTTPPLAVAAVLACALAWRAPSPRQGVIAATLTGLLAVNVAGPWFAPGSDADVAMFAAWWALTAGAVWSVLRKDETPGAEASGGCGNHGAEYVRAKHPPRSREHFRPRCLATSGPASGILLLAAVLASPIAYRHGLDVGRASFALALAVQLLAVARFASRGVKPDDAQRVALALAASSLADVAGPWLFGEPSRDWFVGKWPAVVTWLAVAAWEIRCLTRARR